MFLHRFDFFYKTAPPVTPNVVRSLYFFSLLYHLYQIFFIHLQNDR